MVSFVLDYVLLAAGIILIDVGVPSIPIINGSPPTCCPRHGMNKMDPVTTTVMNLTGSFLEVLGTVHREDIASVQSDQQLTY